MAEDDQTQSGNLDPTDNEDHGDAGIDLPVEDEDDGLDLDDTPGAESESPAAKPSADATATTDAANPRDALSIEDRRALEFTNGNTPEQIDAFYRNKYAPKDQAQANAAATAVPESVEEDVSFSPDDVLTGEQVTKLVSKAVQEAVNGITANQEKKAQADAAEGLEQVHAAQLGRLNISDPSKQLMVRGAAESFAAATGVPIEAAYSKVAADLGFSPTNPEATAQRIEKNLSSQSQRSLGTGGLPADLKKDDNDVDVLSEEYVEDWKAREEAGMLETGVA